MQIPKIDVFCALSSSVVANVSKTTAKPASQSTIILVSGQQVYTHSSRIIRATYAQSCNVIAYRVTVTPNCFLYSIGPCVEVYAFCRHVDTTFLPHCHAYDERSRSSNNLSRAYKQIKLIIRLRSRRPSDVRASVFN